MDLYEFGKMAVTKKPEKFIRKLGNKGDLSILIGYPEHTSKGTYKFLNLATETVLRSRDLVWLDKTLKNKNLLTEDQKNLEKAYPESSSLVLVR